MEKEEKVLDDRYRKAARDMDAENKAARAELEATRKALARERGELASKVRNTAAEAEAASRKVCIPPVVCTSTYMYNIRSRSLRCVFSFFFFSFFFCSCFVSWYYFVFVVRSQRPAGERFSFLF